ncbi:MAG: hypothetical protein HONBIEJF_00704 [Fimbriimonadaceae bacterium]|nr:hypothetical protein [Fimbriimonadaceae bacterium]
MFGDWRWIEDDPVPGVIVSAFQPLKRVGGNEIDRHTVEGSVFIHGCTKNRIDVDCRHLPADRSSGNGQLADAAEDIGHAVTGPYPIPKALAGRQLIEIKACLWAIQQVDLKLKPPTLDLPNGAPGPLEDTRVGLQALGSASRKVASFDNEREGEACEGPKPQVLAPLHRQGTNLNGNCIPISVDH